MSLCLPIFFLTYQKFEHSPFSFLLKLSDCQIKIVFCEFSSRPNTSQQQNTSKRNLGTNRFSIQRFISFIGPFQ
jgi:hypothetical protein